jgi:hypothetical protein
MRFLEPPRPGIDRARILCERDGDGYSDCIFDTWVIAFALTKRGD